MHFRSEKWTLFWPFILLVAVVVVACSPVGEQTESSDTSPPAGEADPTTADGEAEPAPATSTSEPQPTDTPIPEATETADADLEESEDETAPAGQAVTEPEEESIVVDENGIILTDNRSDRMRNATATWATNWNRHTIDYSELLFGGPPRDGIPSIDDPQFISIEAAGEWLEDVEPVIVVEFDGDARAYPLQVLTWHEVANDTVNDIPIVVTFCPLCNSALVFDRRFENQVFEFGTSGLLRNSDLVMYDRTTESLWQQFTGEGIVGDLAGEQLTFLPSSLTSFADFKEAFPDGIVMSRETGFDRPYGQNPYAGYDTYAHPLSFGGDLVLFDGEKDDRLQAADRVVSVSLPDEGVDVAYPVEQLADLGVINDSPGGRPLVIFHVPGTASALGAEIIAQGEDVGATGVFDRRIDGQELTFVGEGELIKDNETGSTWNIFGQAIEGPLVGSNLEPVIHGDHFWFSWAAFNPETIIYEG